MKINEAAVQKGRAEILSRFGDALGGYAEVTIRPDSLAPEHYREVILFDFFSLSEKTRVRFQSIFALGVESKSGPFLIPFGIVQNSGFRKWYGSKRGDSEENGWVRFKGEPDELVVTALMGQPAHFLLYECGTGAIHLGGLGGSSAVANSFDGVIITPKRSA